MNKIKVFAKDWFLCAVLLSIFFVLSRYIYLRVDTTSDKRYTLSSSTDSVIKSIDRPVVIDVLFEGDIPVEYRKLQTEVKQLLQEYRAKNSNIVIHFTNPMEDQPDLDKLLSDMSLYGLTPLEVTTKKDGKTQMSYIFPWAIVNCGDKSQRVPLFKNKLGATTEQRLVLSIESLEYAFTDALSKLLREKTKKIAFIRSNSTLSDLSMADFLSLQGQYYKIAPFTLDSVYVSPHRTLQQLSQYDLVVVPKPMDKFSESQKQVLDQYLMGGGRFLWLVDGVDISMDDLYRNNGLYVAMPLDLNLGDMFFKYGFRINYNIVNDLYFTQIVMAKGQGSGTEYIPVPWVYNPMIISKNNHIINSNLDAMRMQFSSSIDTLGNGIKKTILLQSSDLSKVEGAPKEVTLNVSTKGIDKDSYTKGNYPLAVLLEGEFTSVYKNRIKPVDLPGIKDNGKASKMIVISDGDFIRNDVSQGQPLELGYDKWTNNFYDNKLFLHNCVSYLLDDFDFLKLRNKKVSIGFLNKDKLSTDINHWRYFSIVFPLFLLVVVFCLVYVIYNRIYIRKK